MVPLALHQCGMRLAANLRSLLCWLLMVLGSSGVVPALRGAHHRDLLPGPGCHRVHQLPGQLTGGPTLPDHAVPPRVGHRHLLRLLGCPDDPVRHVLSARDQGGASAGVAGAVSQHWFWGKFVRSSGAVVNAGGVANDDAHISDMKVNSE